MRRRKEGRRAPRPAPAAAAALLAAVAVLCILDCVASRSIIKGAAVINTMKSSERNGQGIKAALVRARLLRLPLFLLGRSSSAATPSQHHPRAHYRS